MLSRQARDNWRFKWNIREAIGEIHLHIIDVLKNGTDRLGYCMASHDWRIVLSNKKRNLLFLKHFPKKKLFAGPCTIYSMHKAEYEMEKSKIFKKTLASECITAKLQVKCYNWSEENKSDLIKEFPISISYPLLHISPSLLNSIPEKNIKKKREKKWRKIDNMVTHT